LCDAPGVRYKITTGNCLEDEMSEKTPVHVVAREDGWVVVREGKERATSVHSTQAEAAKAGREIARKDGTTFLLHANDGRVRDRSDYGDKLTEGESESSMAETGSVATRTAGDVLSQASEIVGGGVDRLGQATQGGTRGSETPDGGTDEAEEVASLTYEERYAEYEVYDQVGKELGKVDTFFLDENDEFEYLGLKMGLLDTESALIPAEVLTVDDLHSRIEVARPSNVVEQGPTLADEAEVTPEFEERVRRHYGLDPAVPSTGGRGTYGAYHAGSPTGRAATETAEAREPSMSSDRPDATGEEELKVQRAEEELKVGTEEREVGALRVRKRVRTDKERIEVPKKRVEVSVERVPVEGGAVPTGEEAATAPEIGEDEIVVPVIEEEVVVEKRPVVKEEIRIRKEVVEDTEVVEEDVRREEVDLDDQTTRRDT